MPASSSNFCVATTPLSDLGGRGRPSATNKRTGRKTYKTDKRGKEAVWPESLEAVLLEAIQLYQPPPSRSGTRSQLQRFPKRNKMIAKYILEVTGKSRSGKQVGSRIQQLRDTCKDPHILRCLNDKKRFETPSDRSRTDSPSPSAPSSRAHSEELVSVPNLALPMRYPTSGALTLSSPSLSPALSMPVSHRISLGIIATDDDWSHHTSYHPAVSLSLTDRIDSDSSYTISVPRTHLHLAPILTIALPRLFGMSIEENTFMTYLNDEPIDFYRAEASLDHEGRLVSQPSSKTWSELVSRMTHDGECTIIQSIRSSAPNSTRIEITYNIHLSFETAPRTPIAFSASPSSYHSPQSPSSFGTDLMSPVEAYDYSTSLASPSSSFSICSPDSTYTYSMPSAPVNYPQQAAYGPADGWLSMQPQLHLPLPSYPASNYFSS